MRESDFDPIRRGQNPYAAEMNRLQRAVVAASDFQTSLGYTGPDGHAATPLPPGRFLIKLISKLAASSGYPARYDWEIVTHDTKGNLLTGYSPEISSAATGFPAIEVFDRNIPDLPAYIEAWLGYGEYLLCDIGCCGADCDTTVEDFTDRTIATALPTDRLLTSDPVNHLLVGYPMSIFRQSMQTTEGVVSDAYGGTITFNLSAGVRHKATLAGNPTLALAGEYSSAMFIVDLIQDGTGSRVATWWSGIRWQGGIPPRQTITPNARDRFAFERLSAGSYLGMASLNF